MFLLFVINMKFWYLKWMNFIFMESQSISLLVLLIHITYMFNYFMLLLTSNCKILIIVLGVLTLILPVATAIVETTF
ncbi:hypothetical protein H5410_002242 [Solanum commersonii]|uniref:Uncharacterized protein n=1 Tax=Solanum commersonii TaxID=4109 RepID=A0A9J6B158_SOLCO|nr:hypothetical protein H5410_002242 [Solanum commersonii]